MKVLVLLAGCVGVIGFFEPFFEYGDVPVSAYRIAHGFDPEQLGLKARPAHLHDLDEGIQWEPADVGLKDHERQSPVPYYFISAIVFLLVGFGAIVIGRLSGFVALPSLAAAMFAIGGWMREVRIDRELVRAGGTGMLAVGAKLLLLSGLLGMLGSVVVLIKREPAKPKPPPPPPDIPVARVIS